MNIINTERYSFNFIKKAQEPDIEFQKQLEEQRKQEALIAIEEKGFV